MRAIITVIGKDKVGIVAGISAELLNHDINIIDINQTIMEEFFTMILMVDLSKSKKSFEEIKKGLTLRGNNLGVDVKIQREEIFNSMHTL
ncbi:MAG: ACT domain-containing protein [Peptostreptococcaceae bacterium]|nr:ACT domain-containing protein [Peptostreptococcaceae bacterium]MDU4934038.1 ACT domain-containing protein [Peptostreptococcaceae bacterium]